MIFNIITEKYSLLGYIYTIILILYFDVIIILYLNAKEKYLNKNVKFK